MIETQQVVPWLEGSPENLQRVSVEYDHLNRVSRTTTYKNNGTEVLKSESPVYDGRGRVTQVLDQNNNVVSQNSYDDFGRLVLKKVNVENGNIQDNYAYHPLGALAFHKSSVQVGSALPTETYSENLTYENAPSDATARYDGLISSITRTRPNTSVKAKLLPIYDALGRLESVRDANHPTASNDTLAALMKYAPDGSLLALNRGTFTAGQVVNNDYIYYSGTHRLASVTGNSMNLINGRKTDGRHGGSGRTNFVYDDVGRMTTDYSKGMTLTWRADDDLPSQVEVYGQTDGWNNDPVIMNFAYKGGARIAKFRNEFLTQTTTKTNEARYYLLGGKEIRVGEDGTIRSVIYPSFAGAGRTTLSVAQNKLTTEFSSLDYLGSTTRVNKFENGAWTQTLSTEYDVWGREIQMVQSGGEEYDDRFTGKKKDVELGLDYFGARYLDKDFGEWASPDKAREFFSLYSYMGNNRNPLNHFDGNGKLTINANSKPAGGYDISVANPKDFSKIELNVNGVNKFSQNMPWLVEKVAGNFDAIGVQLGASCVTGLGAEISTQFMYFPNTGEGAAFKSFSARSGLEIGGGAGIVLANFNGDANNAGIGTWNGDAIDMSVGFLGAFISRPDKSGSNYWDGITLGAAASPSFSFGSVGIGKTSEIKRSE